VIDCHSHIGHSIFDQDRKKVINRARQAGVKTIIAVAENIDDSRLVLKMCRKTETGQDLAS
jgi:Tat protein secretion system quality control protein TatD with DNase activity